MKQDTHKTVVAFLIDRSYEKNKGQNVFAFFPNNKEGAKIHLCYSHIGQYSKCHIEYAALCQPATPEQYEPLKKELEGLGYNLEVTNL